MRSLLLLALLSAPGQAPKPDGVTLSPKEYQALAAAADAAKKPQKPVPPSECHIRGSVSAAGARAVAKLQLTFAFRTTVSQTVLNLGCQRAFPAAAGQLAGKTAALGTAEDGGVTLTVDEPGAYTFTLDVEVGVAGRGGKGEVGFEFGLPRAAVTTLSLTTPAAGKLTVSTKDAADARRTTDDPARYATPAGTNGPALGAVESVEVTWDPPAAGPAAEQPPAAEIDAVVRVEDAFVETVAKVRLRGTARDWQLVLPAGADLAADPRPGGAAIITRPADPKQPVWGVKTTDGGEFALTATSRQPRTDPKAAGPFPVGPVFARGAAKQSGTLKVFAPAGIQIRVTAPAEVRPQDAPPPADDAPVGVYRFAAAPLRNNQPVPLAAIEATPARGFIVARPAYKLRLTEAGWRLRADVRITPVRADADQVAVDFPSGWQSPDAGPPELVADAVTVGGRVVVKLTSPRKEPFDLTLEATFPVAAAARTAAVPLPRFPQAAERNATLTATVPDGFEVRGTARDAAGGPVELAPPAPPPPGTGATTAAARFDAGAARVDLAWKPFRPEIAAAVTADVTPGDRQLAVTQTLKFTAAGPLPAAIKLKGPANMVGLRAAPPPDPTAPGEWAVPVPAGAKELTVTLSYAVPLGAGAKAAVPLVWPDATRVETVVRVWLGGGRRAAAAEGPWQDLPPEPTADRDSLPGLTLAGAGPDLPLSVEFADAGGGAAAVVVDRAAVQAWVGDDGTVQARGRFVLRRWPGVVEVEVPTPGPVAAFIDGRKVDAAPALGDGPDGRVLRVPLPDSRGRASIELDIRYAPPPGAGPYGEAGLPPPHVRGAAYRAAVRWQVVVPPQTVPLVPAGGFAADVRWGWRGWAFAPGPAAAAADLDAWLAGGTAPADADPDAPAWVDAAGEAVTGRQAAPARVRLVRVPRVGWVVACSAVVFVLGVVVARVRPGLLGPALAVLGLAAAAVAVVAPQAAGQAAAGAEPGAAALLLWLAGAAAVRAYYRRKITHLSGFSRVPAGGSAVGSKSGSARGSAAAGPA